MRWEAEGTLAVTVNDQEWTLVPSLQQAGSSDTVYALNPETGAITFGDGVRGAAIPVGSNISATYSAGDGSIGKISKRIDEIGDVERFWILIRPDRQILGWGRLRVELH